MKYKYFGVLEEEKDIELPDGAIFVGKAKFLSEVGKDVYRLMFLVPESIDKGDTKAERLCGEKGIKEELIHLRQEVHTALQVLINFNDSSLPIAKNELEFALSNIDSLIQKHETKNG